MLKPAGIRRRYTCYLPAIMLETMVQDDIEWHESVDIARLYGTIIEWMTPYGTTRD